MKTQEELNKLKKEVETVNDKFVELSDEELDSVVGGQNGRSMMKCAGENVASTTVILRTLKG